MTPTVTAAAGFLLAVLWFDLMFDVQVLPYHAAPEVPEHVLASIAAYYHRVTTTASPMGRLVALMMAVLLGALVAQAVRGDTPRWVSAMSIAGATIAIGLAAVRVFGAARRLGARTDSPEVQSSIARSILRGHLVCLAAMLMVLALQLGAA